MSVEILPNGHPFQRKEDLAEGVTLYLGDCREVLPTLGKIASVITDPPYSIGARTDSERQVFSDLRQHLVEGAHVYVFMDWRRTPNVYGMLEACGYRVNHSLVWAKPYLGMGAYGRNQHENIVFASNGVPNKMRDRGNGSILSFTNVSPAARVHPTEKPVDLLVDIIDAIPGDDVFDPFMGDGSTGVAAVKRRRGFIGCEINPGHFDIACRRIAAALKQPDLFRVGVSHDRRCIAGFIRR